MYLTTGEKLDIGENTTILFLQDCDMESPREWDNLGTFVNYHQKYLIGDVNKSVMSKVTKDAISLPVYIYDHGNISLNTTGFSCPWDSGQIGFIYVEKSKIRKELGCKRVTKSVKFKVLEMLKQEIATLNLYVSDQVYMYQIEDQFGETIDSCGGFYGDDMQKNGMLGCIDEKYHASIESALSEY